jgi:hypothetical protein
VPILIAESSDEDDRILVFGSRTLIDDFLGRCQDSQDLSADGTFLASPVLFAQLYVIRCGVDGYFFPLCYCLLPNKTLATFARLWTILKGAIPRLSPSRL